jgi:dihydroorotate dehydrogenase
LLDKNTTLEGAGMGGYPNAMEQGGVGGPPRRARATDVIGTLCRELKGEIPVVGVGGIMNGADAAEKMAAGASLVQIYSGLVFRGPELVHECVSACLARSRTASTASR